MQVVVGCFTHRRSWQIACLAHQWYDLAVTFYMEYSRIWRARFTGATLIYLLIRYGTAIDSIVAVVELLSEGSDERVRYLSWLGDNSCAN